MDEPTTTIDWQAFARHFEAYERNLAIGELTNAKSHLTNAMLTCPSTTLLASLQGLYGHLPDVKPFNVWAWAKNTFGSPDKLTAKTVYRNKALR
ncbi:MAG: hypothetical protein JSS66_05960 [Armatimonadetes bacterium]|nr:hypothetical protein [Armatimonadota bacterium]